MWNVSSRKKQKEEVTLMKFNSLNKKKFTTCPAFAEKVVDRTGAGDTIIAVSTLCFKQKIPDDITLLVGNVSAASTVLHLGTGNSIEKNEILKKIRYIFK